MDSAWIPPTLLNIRQNRSFTDFTESNSFSSNNTIHQSSNTWHWLSWNQAVCSSAAVLNQSMAERLREENRHGCPYWHSQLFPPLFLFSSSSQHACWVTCCWVTSAGLTSSLYLSPICYTLSKEWVRGTDSPMTWSTTERTTAVFTRGTFQSSNKEETAKKTFMA